MLKIKTIKRLKNNKKKKKKKTQTSIRSLGWSIESLGWSIESSKNSMTRKIQSTKSNQTYYQF